MAARTEAQIRAQKKYMKGVATIQIRTDAEKRDRINAFAARRGQSVNELINQLLDEAMAKEDTRQ
jgi:predicted HicB family RNase H-like nuclease